MRRHTLLLAITLVLATMLAGCGVEGLLADDYGSRDYQTYEISSADDPDAPTILSTPPGWVIGVAAEDAPEDDPSHATTHLTCTFATGHYVLTYGDEDALGYVEYYASEDTIVTDHLFGGRYTQIEVGDVRQGQVGGHDVVWGSYTYHDEYDRLNVTYVSAAQVEGGQVLTLMATEEIREEGSEPFLTDDVFSQVWESVSW